MTIPSEDQFNESLNLLETFDAIELIEKYWDLSNLDGCSREQEFKRSFLQASISKGSSFRDYYVDYYLYGQFKLELTPEGITRFLEETDDLLKAKAEKILQTSAIIWLKSQPASRAAEKNIFGSDYEDFEYSETHETIVSRWLSIEHEGSLRDRVVSHLEKSHGRFYQILLSKLKNYFYSDFEQYLDSLKKREVVAKKAKRHIDELVEIESVLSKLEGRDEVFDIWSRRGHSRKIIRLLERTSLEIEDITLLPSLRPIRKGDATAKERLMVFNLWRSFRRDRIFQYDYKVNTKTNFVTAISHLMYLEGIENPIGQRAIEKLIQGWKSTRKNPPDPILDAEQWEERQQLKRKYPIHFR